MQTETFHFTKIDLVREKCIVGSFFFSLRDLVSPYVVLGKRSCTVLSQEKNDNNVLNQELKKLL